jgi:dihydrodipicolinate synthase/N-acetylneuraminate lyase
MPAALTGTLVPLLTPFRPEELPVFDVLRRSANPTGTLKAGLRLLGIEVGAPRRPGRALGREHLEALESHLRALPGLEAEAERDLSAGRDAITTSS